MSEEEKRTAPVETGTPSPAEPPTEPPKQAPDPKQKSRSRPVKVYLTVLFLAAFLLLLLSFFMQQRNHQAIVDLGSDIRSTQQIAELEQENQELRHQLDALEDEKAALEDRCAEAQRAADAIEWLRQMEQAENDSHQSARALAERFDETGLEDALPSTSPVEGAESPAKDYRDLYARLF